jgi:peptide methionine sulfoxide reductase MsrB
MKRNHYNELSSGTENSELGEYQKVVRTEGVESKVTCTASRSLFKSKPVFDSELGHELSYVVKISP